MCVPEQPLSSIRHSIRDITNYIHIKCCCCCYYYYITSESYYWCLRHISVYCISLSLSLSLCRLFRSQWWTLIRRGPMYALLPDALRWVTAGCSSSGLRLQLCICTGAHAENTHQHETQIPSTAPAHPRHLCWFSVALPKRRSSPHTQAQAWDDPQILFH